MRRIACSIGLFALVIGVPALYSQDNYAVVNGPENTYYGHISLVEIQNDGKDPVVIRPGAEAPLPAVLNFPLGPGDTIKTTDARRVEIQFDNATIIRLDRATELKIETILARSLSRRETAMTNLVLSKGRIYVMYKEYDHTELFQVLTPNAAVKLRHNTVATISAAAGETDIQVAFGKAAAMFGPDENHLFESSAGRNERLVVDARGKAMTGVPSPDPEFAAYNDSINKNFEGLHEGKSVLPKPLIRGVTKATWYFAQTFGDLYGEWLYDDLYGYVWRPYYNDRYPGGQWRPYIYGQWVNMTGQMFWIPQEPWGWVPYHLGVWQWDAKRGWFWIPGSAFAPAWVDWAYMNGMYYAWRPWSLFDWTYYGGFLGMDAYWYGMGGPYGYYPYFGFYYGNGDGDQNFRATLNKVSKDQLKKPAASPALTMPKGYSRLVKAIEAGLKRGDARLMESLGAAARPTLLAGSRVVNPQSLPRRSDLAPTALDRGWRVSRALSGMIAPTETLTTRRTDWNPDVRLGARLGVNIRYASGTNEVVCPELRLSSAMMGRAVLVERGSARGSGSSSGAVVSGGSMSTAGTSVSSSSGGSSGGASSGGGGGGHIR
jgi:uncharacterized membrane protein YgcG